MKVRDIEYVEDDLIAGVEKFLPEAREFREELQTKALGVATSKAAKEESFKCSVAGVLDTKKTSRTVPVSPRLSKGRPPKLPEPEEVIQHFHSKKVPENIDSTSLQVITKTRLEELELQRTKTKAKYDEKNHFNFQKMKAGRNIEEARREVEIERTKNLQFDSSFVNPAPDFMKIPGKVRLNAAAIYREDSLFRKQQAKDAEILRKYEEELRDPVEFLIWQKEMKMKDRQSELDLIALRKSETRQSHVESLEAMQKQKEDNRLAADVQREQAELSQQQKELDLEIELLRNQSAVQSIMDIRDTRPRLAVERDVESRAEIGRSLREDVQSALREKEERDRVEEEIRADRIRQLRADNLVNKKQPVIFDPTVIGGVGFLDEMSYTEMKIRLENEKSKVERCEKDRRLRIIDEKDKKARDLEERARTLMRIRQAKTDANKAINLKKKTADELDSAAKEKERQEAAIKLHDDFKVKREQKKQVAAILEAEEDRAKRHRLYLGAAADLIEETREKDLLKGKEKIQSTSQRTAKEEAILREKTQASDKANRLNQAKQIKSAKQIAANISNQTALDERKRAVEKLREEVLMKRSMNLEGKEQHAATRTRLAELNPYAVNISLESVATVHNKAGTIRLGSAGNTARSVGGHAMTPR